jgi:hypothetical protein
MSSPTDNWDDWGDNTSSQPSTENTQQSGNDDWGDWGDSGEQSQQESSSDGWDDWGSDSQQTDTKQSWDTWGSSTDQNQSGSNFIDDSQDANQTWSSQPQDYQTQSPTEPPIQTHFSTKTIAIIVAVVILGIALLLMGIDKIHFSKKPADTNTNTTTSTVQQQQQDDDNTQQSNNTQSDNTSEDSQSNNALNSATLVEIPDSASMTYSNDTLKANGKVTDKKKYVQGKQIVYCVEITIAVGSSSETVNYYCTSATFNQVGMGDILIVNYVQVDDSYISITNVEK